MPRSTRSLDGGRGGREGILLVDEPITWRYHTGTDFLREGLEGHVALFLILHHLLERGRDGGALGREDALPHLFRDELVMAVGEAERGLDGHPRLRGYDQVIYCF